MAVADRRTKQRKQRAAERADRFDARLSPEQKRVLLKAAAYAGQPLSQFVLTSAQRAAEQVIREHEVITLSVRDSQAVMEALRNPGPAHPNLVGAAEEYKAFMDEQ